MNNSINDDLLQLSIREAKKSPHPLFKHGAIVIKDKKVVATGYNHKRYHAESFALFKLPKSIRLNSIVIVVRVTKNLHRITMSGPCTSCLSTMKRMGVKTVFYSTHNGEIASKRL